MPNELRQRWDSLKNDARLAGLPVPVLQPHNFQTRWGAKVGDWAWVGREPLEAMSKAELWVAGYSTRMLADQDAYDTAVEQITVREACKRVIEGSGVGGPSDHVLLAKALLALGDELFPGET